MYNSNQKFAQYLIDIKDSSKPLLIMAFVTFAVTMLYVYLLKWFARPLLYISIVAILIAGIIGGLYLWTLRSKYEGVPNSKNSKYLMIGAIVTWAITGLYLMCILCQYNHIALGAGILAASSEYLSSNNRIAFLPIITYILLLPVMCIWALVTVYLMSIGTPYFKENSFICAVTYEKYTEYLFWANLFGFFWVVAFTIAV